MTRRQFRRKTRAMNRQAKRQWRHLSPLQRAAIVFGTVVQASLLAAAHYDLSRRSADEVRGPKSMWRLLVFINVLGPLLYFAVGRKKAEPAAAETQGSDDRHRAGLAS